MQVAPVGDIVFLKNKHALTTRSTITPCLSLSASRIPSPLSAMIDDRPCYFCRKYNVNMYNVRTFISCITDDYLLVKKGVTVEVTSVISKSKV